MRSNILMRKNFFKLIPFFLILVTGWIGMRSIPIMTLPVKDELKTPKKLLEVPLRDSVQPVHIKSLKEKSISPKANLIKFTYRKKHKLKRFQIHSRSPIQTPNPPKLESFVNLANTTPLTQVLAPPENVSGDRIRIYAGTHDTANPGVQRGIKTQTRNEGFSSKPSQKDAQSTRQKLEHTSSPASTQSSGRQAGQKYKS